MSPIYDYECMKCGKSTERFDHVQNKRSRLKCSCGGRAKSIITYKSKPEVLGYYEEAIDFYIPSKKAKRQFLRENEIVEK